ncbi:MAG: pyruvate kinase alpha/beta domain-containing protein [Chloroflexota bacterium]
MANVTVAYFDQTTPANIDEVLRLAKKRAGELGIDTFVVASTSGRVGVKAAEVFRGKQVVVVTHVTGYTEPNIQQLTEENRKRILELGSAIHTATHAMGGFGRAVRVKLGSYQIDEIVANALRLLGNGLKVACEITAMAADAGLVRTDREVIAIAGSHEGADTAIVVQPANVHRFFDMKVKEIICMPRQ